MEVVYGLIPMMLIFGVLVVGVFIWMAKTGHFDDLDGAAHSIFMDDDVPSPTVKQNNPVDASPTEKDVVTTPETEQMPSDIKS